MSFFKKVNLFILYHGKLSKGFFPPEINANVLSLGLPKSQKFKVIVTGLHSLCRLCCRTCQPPFSETPYVPCFTIVWPIIAFIFLWPSVFCILSILFYFFLLYVVFMHMSMGICIFEYVKTETREGRWMSFSITLYLNSF